MRKLLRLSFAMSVLLMVGCAYSVEMLKQDEDLRHKVLLDCAKKGISAAKDDQSCINAGIAQAEVSGKSLGESVKGLIKDLDL